MTQATNNYLVTYKKLHNTSENLSGLSLNDNYESLYIYSFSLPIEKVLNEQNLYCHNCCQKFLDRFLIIPPISKISVRNFWQHFFDYYSSSYEELICIDKNLQNISFLFNNICYYTKVNKDSRILDFACGTGLSTNVINNVDLFGVDSSHKMLNIASSRGLNTITLETLQSQNNYYDGIFSSYGFHICHDEEILATIWKSMKIGASLVVNYHKGIGVKEVNEFVIKKYGTIIDISGKANYAFGQCYVYIKNDLFICRDEAQDIIKKDLLLSSFYIDTLFKYRIIPTFKMNGKNLLLKHDMDTILNLCKNRDIEELEKFITKIVRIEKYTSPDIYSLIKNIFYLFINDFEKHDVCKNIKSHYANFKSRKKLVESSKKAQFARSAYYMGSKVGLRSFIIECLSTKHISKSTMIDLMAGSGAVAGLFCNFTNTIASDVMQFSKYLSTVQGGGYTKKRAIQSIKNIKMHYMKHYDDVKINYLELMLAEDNFLKIDDTKENLNHYLKFLERLSSYLTYNSDNNMEIEKRMKNPKIYPYILVTEYYANVFFGVNQSVQIDSLRYAIDMLNDKNDKTWALGALVSTCSHISSSHASHFAQPAVVIDKNKNIKYENIKKLLFQRKISVWREFEAIFLSLAEESEKTPFTISFSEGPWKEALQRVETHIDYNEPIIYIDAPYKREEYSRYYHVLETIINYNYPEIQGKGKMPPKSRTKGIKTIGERFYSEFFTKTPQEVEKIFIDIFTSILKKGWFCAWSYSDNGMASITNVVNAVASEVSCSITTYSTPYSHKSQNSAAKSKEVEEYLILLSPR